MPRNRSEKVPHYSPAVTAWFIAYRHVRHGDNTHTQSDEENRLYYLMTNDEQEKWGNMPWSEIDPIIKQVYDAAQSK